MRNKWTLSGDLKSPGLKTVPVRFRLAAPESSCNLLMDCRSFCCILIKSIPEMKANAELLNYISINVKI